MNPPDEYPRPQRTPSDADSVAGGDAADHVIDGLIEQNRVLQGSRMIPTVGPLMDGHHQQVRDALEAFIAQHDTKLSRVAAGTKFTPSVISEWRAGKYEGDADAVAKAVNRWLERETRRLATVRPSEYVRTRVAEAMFAIVAEADRRNMMAAIVAPSGTGKSLVLKAVAQDTRGAYLDCRKAARSPRAFVKQLLVSLGCGLRNGSRDELLEYLLAYLRGRRLLILIDEAQHLRPEHLSIVRTIHDLAETPIIMAGTASIFTAIDDRSSGGGQFASRCLRFNLESKFGVTAGDGNGGRASAGAELFTVEEVRRFLDMKRIRLTPEAIDFVRKLACIPRWGGLRFVLQLVELPATREGVELVTLQALYATLADAYGEDMAFITDELQRFDERQAATPKGRVA